MPEVFVRYKERVPVILVDRLCRQVLPQEVAEALHIPEMLEAHLTPANIQVWADRVDVFDVQRVDVAVIVNANDCPPRRAKLKLATVHLLIKISEALTTTKDPVDVTGYPGRVRFSSNVKVMLTPGAFEESR